MGLSLDVLLAKGLPFHNELRDSLAPFRKETP